MKVDENERIATQLAWKETKQHLVSQMTTLTVGLSLPENSLSSSLLNDIYPPLFLVFSEG